jgi:hypothetical protein
MLKKILLILILVIGAILIINQKKDENVNSGAQTGENAVEGKLKVANFSGPLEEVNTGCFADGECYVVVDGKHVTAIMGWSQETVGSVQGVEGFGDLENHIGKEVEVYAQDSGDGKYTLYGSEGFYIRLK